MNRMYMLACSQTRSYIQGNNSNIHPNFCYRDPWQVLLLLQPPNVACDISVKHVCHYQWELLRGITAVVFHHLVNICTKAAFLIEWKLCNHYLVLLHDKHDSCTPRHGYLSRCCACCVNHPGLFLHPSASTVYPLLLLPNSWVFFFIPLFLFLWGKGDCQL